MQSQSVPLATETVPTVPFQQCLKPDRDNQWRHPAGDRPADPEEKCEWSTHMNTPQHFSVCCPVHVYSDPASTHVLVSLHPHARDHSSNALALGSSHTEKGHLLYTCAPDIIKCLHGSGAAWLLHSLRCDGGVRAEGRKTTLGTPCRGVESIVGNMQECCRRAAWRVITSVEQVETSKGDEQLVSNARE